LFGISLLNSKSDVKIPEKRISDRRIQKTRRLLHEALFSLIHEKDYDTIVVKEILDRANVGRSTFYTHFNDKDELLVSVMQDMLRSVQSTRLPSSATRNEDIIRFSLPIFEHVSQHLGAGKSRIGSRGRALIHEHLQKVLAELISGGIRKQSQGRPQKAGEIPPDLFVQYVASTFILVLNWWVESRSPLRPTEVNELFRGLILPTLAAVLK
jgi:AcrR family transcriptional regulator